MRRNATFVVVVFSALLLASVASAATISVSTDVLLPSSFTNILAPGAGNLPNNAGSAGAQVNLVSFIPNSPGPFTAIPYNQAGATIDVSAYVDPTGAARGAGQGIEINTYTPTMGPGVGNLYLAGQNPNVNNSGFGAHANWLVTLDLNAIRAADFTGSTRLALTGTFGAYGGIGDPSGGVITGGIYLDGVQSLVMQSSFTPVSNPTFDFLIPASAHYLTFTILNIPGSSLWDDGLFENVNLTAVPEPSTLILAGLGLVGLLFVRRRNGSSVAVCSAPVVASLVFAAVLLAGFSGAAFAGGVAVGSSTLIGTLDYSDTFTLTANGGEAGRNVGAFPLSTQNGGAGLAIENTYANSAQNWTDGQWSINSDAVINSGNTTYPGSSGAGSASGITQTGVATNGAEVYGLNYAPARSNYVAQFDAVQTGDWVDITSSNLVNSISGTSSLSVLFRQDGGAVPSIGIYSLANGETGVPGATTGLIDGTWNNYAVDFDHVKNTLEIYVNQTLKATVDLTTFDGGAYQTHSNATISFGAAGGGGNRVWTDNVQIGAVATPEPATWIMGAMGLTGLVALARRKR